MKIEGITVSEILDSRKEKTIEVAVNTSAGSFSTQLPSGKSKGKNEAVTLGLENAKNVLKSGLEKEIGETDFNTITDLDKFLIGYDGTENKSKIGGDLSLGISISFARALANEKGVELWQILREEYFGGVFAESPPKIFSNMINGGSHADDNLDIQEYQVVGITKEGITHTVKEIKNLYTRLGEILTAKFGVGAIKFGDEQGYALDFNDNFEPLKILGELLYESIYKDDFKLGIDVAASGLSNGVSYKFENKTISRNELQNIYTKYLKNCDSLKYIEDPFAEFDEIGFENMFSGLGDKIVIIGDDLTTTRKESIMQYSGKAINGVIIKPNQIGTVTETCEAMLAARKKNIEMIISHRSGEVNDPFIIHFAKAVGAEGVKIGVPVIKERISKFDELTKLYS